MRTIVAVLFTSIATVHASAQDPAVAINEARVHVAARRYTEALEVLNGALEAAERLSGGERTQAVAAVHFYSAVALSGTNADSAAKAHLMELFRLIPTARLTGSVRYDPRFMALFNEMSRRANNADLRFEAFYPGFNSLAAAGTAEAPAGTWGDSPALILLGSKREKREWESIMSIGDRARFIEEFWKRRDPTPQTPENEFRETFERRVAFADRVFGSTDSRGAINDRGKVFVLLGEPSSVRRRPIMNRDRVLIFEPAVVNGTIEQWVYAREQLPIAIGKKGVVFRFVTQSGIGDNVLQREDVYGFQALAAAMNPNERH